MRSNGDVSLCFWASQAIWNVSNRAIFANIQSLEKMQYRPILTKLYVLNTGMLLHSCCAKNCLICFFCKKNTQKKLIHQENVTKTASSFWRKYTEQKPFPLGRALTLEVSREAPSVWTHNNLEKYHFTLLESVI